MPHTLRSSVSDSSTEPTWWLKALSVNSFRSSGLQPSNSSATSSPAGERCG
ncbi:hypothetical protein ACFQ2Y_45220 [Streptomyces malaysiensis subsp. malaysiensis]